MRNFWVKIVIIILTWSTSIAFGQKETERYIPMGKSPGLSNKYTIIGTIQTVDERDKTISIAGSAGVEPVKITGQTRIWLDRTKLKLNNLNGRFEDLQAGRMVEIKYLDFERKQIADWIKLEVTHVETKGDATSDQK